MGERLAMDSLYLNPQPPEQVDPEPFVLLKGANGQEIRFPITVQVPQRQRATVDARTPNRRGK